MIGYFHECTVGCACGSVKSEGVKLMVMARSGSSDWQDEYLNRLVPMFESIEGEAIGKVADWMNSRESVPSSQEFEMEVGRILGDEYSKINPSVAEAFVEEMYVFNFASDRLAPAAGVSFGGADLRAIDSLAGSDNLVLSKFLKNKDAAGPLRNFIKEQYLEGGEGMFGRGDPAVIADFKRRLGAKLKDISTKQLRRAVETSVQRIRNRGQLQQLQSIQSVNLQIFEPTRECPFCREMHLKIINVSAAVRRAAFLDTLSESKFLGQFKIDRNKPELENLTRFIEEGMLPPYHPNCHGRVRVAR